jgi:hypothetical protein
MNYALLIALGLLFLATSFIPPHPTHKLVFVVLSCVMFLLAAVASLTDAGVFG